MDSKKFGLWSSFVCALAGLYCLGEAVTLVVSAGPESPEDYLTLFLACMVAGIFFKPKDNG